jgi:1,2-diacylglycerol 3-alpha-glucosyltransferase
VKKKNLKIAFLPSTFLPIIGGAEIQTHNLANSISRKGHLVDVWCTKKAFYNRKLYNIINFNKIILNSTYILRYYLNIKFNLILKIYFKKIIRSKKYDVWHFHSLNFKTFIIFEVLKELNQKVVFTFQGADIQLNKKIKYGYRLDLKYDKILKQNLKYVDRFHSISNEIDKNLYKLNISQKKILRVFNNTDYFKIKKVKIEKKTKKLTLITVARYSEKKKGFDFIEKISSHLIKKIDFKWIIIGRNVRELSNKNFFSKYPKNFEFIKEIGNDELFFPNSKLIKYYKSSSIYAHLSRIESFGISILEAIYSGLPIISFRSTGSETLIKNGKNGFLIKCFDLKEYAKKIIQLQYTKKNKFNTNHLNRYDLDFNSNKTIKDYKNLLKDNLKKNNCLNNVS